MILPRLLHTLLLLAPVLPLAAQERPVVVVISVDQLRYDYLQRFAPWFAERGFKRLEREGASFTNARHRHAVTSTGPGHAAIGGGTLPSENGVVANRWLERDAPVDPARWSAYFDETSPYRQPGTAASPFDASGERWWKNGGSPRAAGSFDASAMEGDSLAQALKRKRPEARVLALALTDRAALLMGGPAADAAFWFDGATARFVAAPHSPRYDAVLAFNELVPGYMPASARWRPSALELQNAAYDPPAAWPFKNPAYGTTFPHSIPTLRALQFTPFAHEMLFDFALHALALENPDLLFVGISSTDYLGHLYGPESMEVADSMIRLDRSLGAFLDALERRYGDQLIIALTSDHGVQSLPEIARLRNPEADAGRVDLRNPHPNARLIRDLPPARVALERAMARSLGTPFATDAPLQHALVFFFEESGLYLNWPRIRALGLDGERVKKALRNAIQSIDGVASAWTSSEIGTAPSIIRASFRADRSGDVILALRPGWIWMWGSNSTTHGQPVEADLHVPLMLRGRGIIPGRYEEEASPLDLARTLGALLGFKAGGRESHVLPCVQVP